jgi:hypothetical protein
MRHLDKKRFCRLATLALAAFAMFAVPRPAPSATLAPAAPTPPPNSTVTYTYGTFLDPTIGYGQFRKFTVDFGTATLTFNPDKTIRGTYKRDVGSPTTVIGGLTGGGNLWLQIGSRRFAGRFTSRGLAVFSTQRAAGSTWGLWGQFVHA